MFQKYPTGSTVYNFYFDYDTSELVHKELIVSGYDYMDGCQWSVIDEYRLEEHFYKPKFYFFKTKCVYVYKICGHLISDKPEYAKTKFLHNFLNTFTPYERIPANILKMYETAKEEYNKILDTNPEYLFKAITKKMAENTQLQDLWRY